MVNLGLMYIEALGVRRDDVRGYALVAAAVAMGLPMTCRNSHPLRSARLPRVSTREAWQRLNFGRAGSS